MWKESRNCTQILLEFKVCVRTHYIQTHTFIPVTLDFCTHTIQNTTDNNRHTTVS